MDEKIYRQKNTLKKTRDEKSRDEKVRDEKLRVKNLRTKKCPTKIRRTKIGADTVCGVACFFFKPCVCIFQVISGKLKLKICIFGSFFMSLTVEVP